MNTLEIEKNSPRATRVQFDESALTVDLEDGRTISVPLAWYPRLLEGTEEERKQFRFIGGGEGIHWEALDEDISVENLLSGGPSQESESSLSNWLKSRKKMMGQQGDGSDVNG